MLPILKLKKNEDRRIRTGHLWIYSNEIESSLKNFSPGQEVIVEAHDKTPLGLAYVNPHSLIAARLVSRNSNDRLNQDFFIKKFQTALLMRQRLFAKPYYRLIFGEGDFIPGLVIDRFNETIVIQTNTAGMDAHLEDIMTALRQVLPDIQHILLRNDSSARLIEGLSSEIKAGFGNPPKNICLEENNSLFDAPLWEGQKTGWFYDHRLNRTRLQYYVPNKRVLDVFSYLGAWGIQAAIAGAKEVVCLDSSKLSATAIPHNAELNKVKDKVAVIIDDAFSGLKNLYQNKETFDVVILDPPAFIKKQRDLKEGLLAYQRINEAALKLLPDNGILISCSCSMHLSYNDLLQLLRRAAYRSGCQLQLLERGHQAQDHPVHLAIPETDYLKMLILGLVKERSKGILGKRDNNGPCNNNCTGH